MGGDTPLYVLCLIGVAWLCYWCELGTKRRFSPFNYEATETKAKPVKRRGIRDDSRSPGMAHLRPPPRSKPARPPSGPRSPQ